MYTNIWGKAEQNLQVIKQQSEIFRNFKVQPNDNSLLAGIFKSLFGAIWSCGLPLLLPVVVLTLVILSFAPCILNLIVKFVSSHLKAIKLQMVTKMQPILNASMMKFYEGPLSRSSSGGLA
jgi:hypothetical protein